MGLNNNRGNTMRPMSIPELKVTVKGLKKKLQDKVYGRVMRIARLGENRPRQSPSSNIHPASLAIAREIIKDPNGSYRLVEEILSLSPRNGMSAYEMLKRTKKG